MPLSFSTLQPSLRLADQVAQQLAAEIRLGRVQPGDKLPTEAALVKQFGVSRTVIREALSQLKSQNLVDSRQGSGVFVRAAGIQPLQFDPAQAATRTAVIQIAEMRRALEAEVAEMAARRRQPADVAAIREAVLQLAQAVRQGRDGVEEDLAFHRSIAQCAGNPYLIRTLEFLSQFLRTATRLTRANEAMRSDFAEAVTQEHDRIVRAIEVGDPVAARTAAASHMDNAIARIQQADAAFWQQHAPRAADGLLHAPT